MAGVYTPVAVATALSDGTPYGTTVSAFASLSMTLPMALVSLDRGSDLLIAVRASESFGGECAYPRAVGARRSVRPQGWPGEVRRRAVGGLGGRAGDPGAAGFVACNVDRLIEAGDHVVVLGRVVAAHSDHGDPLTYHRRVFGTHLALELS